MLRDHFLAFDEVIVPGVNYFSSSEFDRRFAAYDQMAFHVEPYDVVASGSWSVQTELQTSGDGENWAYVVDSVLELENGANPPFDTAFGSWDSAVHPLMQLARINVYGTGSFTSSGFRVYVCLRDQGGGRPKPVPGVPGGRRAP